MAHLKEKQIMMRNAVEIQKQQLAQLLVDKQVARTNLLNLKSIRGHLRKEIYQVTFQGGLLSKPALMIDYDETSEKLAKVTSEVQAKRKHLAELIERIELMENSMENNY